MSIRSIRFVLLCLLTFFALLIYAVQIEPSQATSSFSKESLSLQLLVLFFLAEPHFALTIPLLYGYRSKFKTNPVAMVYFPLAISIMAAIIFFLTPNIFSLVFLLANIYHVNRQSRGMFQLQGSASFGEAEIYGNLLHVFAFTCIILRTLEVANASFYGVSLAITLLAISCGIHGFNKNGWPEFATVMSATQGFLVFLPVVLFENLMLAFAVGISIHYLQYLFIGSKVCVKGFGFKLLPLFAIVILYSTASSLALGGFITADKVSMIIFVPTMLQLLHFYYDGLIWRRADPIVFTTLQRTSL